MKRIAILSLVLSLVVLTGAFAFFPRTAHADNPPGYDIEVQMLYCINKDKPCNTPATIRNSLFIEVQAVSFHSGTTAGTPDAVNFTCGHAYIDNNGMFHDVAEHVFAGPTQFGYNGGTIKGQAELEKAYTENSTRAVSEIEGVHASDPVTGDSGTAWGKMTSNNVTDLRVSGGFHLELHGPIYDESFPPSGPPVIKVVGHGEMKCSSYGKYVKAPFASGPYFEGVLGNTDND
jgi:hypothetical protein